MRGPRSQRRLQGRGREGDRHLTRLGSRTSPSSPTSTGSSSPCLADADHEVADAYGTWIEKQRPTGRAQGSAPGRNYGRTYWGVQRATFIIDPEGQIARVFPKVSPQTHDDVVIDALGELPAKSS